jgi:hypothetical protein
MRLFPTIFRTSPYFAFILFALVTTWFVVFPPPLPFLRASGDWLALLDAAYRFEHGMWPYLDFSAPIGPITLGLVWVATMIDQTARAFWLLNGLQWILLAPFGGFLALQQRNTARKLLVIIGFSLPLLMPYVIDNPALPEFNGNGVYNRLASSALFLLFGGLLTPKKRGIGWTAWLAGLLAVLLFTKVTAALVGVIAITTFAIFSPVLRRHFIAALIIVGAASITLEGFTRLPSAYLGDIAALASVNQGRTLYFAATMILKAWPAVFMLAILSWLWANELLRSKLSARMIFVRPIASLRVLRAPLSVAVIGGGTLLAESQNTGALNLFGAVSLGLIVLPRRVIGRSRYAVTLSLALLSCTLPYLDNIVSRFSQFVVRQRIDLVSDPDLDQVLKDYRVPRATLLDARELTADWRATGKPETRLMRNTVLSPAYAVAQLQLLLHAIQNAKDTGLLGASTRTASIVLVDLATRISGTKPAKGTMLWLDPARTFGNLDLAEARAYLHNVDAAFEPTCGVTQETSEVKQRFQKALTVDFKPYYPGRCWTLWKR